MTERREKLKEPIDNLNTIIKLNDVKLIDLIFLFYCNKRLTDTQFLKIRDILNGSE